MRRAFWLGLIVAALPLAWVSTRSQEFVELSGANIDLRNGGAAAKADWLRYKLVEVNGPTGGYILAAGHGDQRGYLGTLNALTGGEVLGALFKAQDITTCERIPTFGALTGTFSGDGRTLKARAELGAGTRSLPAHHHAAGTTYEKQIVLFKEDTAVLEVQLSCADAAGYTSVYYYRPTEDESDRPHEAYFQRNERTGLSQVDFYMSHAESGEKYAFRFVSDSSGVVHIWNIRAMTKSRDSSGFAAAYNPSSGLALTGFLTGAHDTSDATSLADSDLECLNLTQNRPSSDCSTSGLTIAAPAQTADVGGESHAFTIAGVSVMKLRTDRPARTREQRAETNKNDAGIEDDAGSDQGSRVGYDDEDAGR